MYILILQKLNKNFLLKAWKLLLTQLRGRNLLCRRGPGHSRKGWVGRASLEQAVFGLVSATLLARCPGKNNLKFLRFRKLKFLKRLCT